MSGFKFLKSSIIVLGFCVVIMSVSFALRDFCQDFISKTMSDFTQIENVISSMESEEDDKSGIIVVIPNEPDDQNESNVRDTGEEALPEVSEFHIGRENYEVSSGRITLFKQGWEIFKHNPILGIGRANLTQYSKRYIKGGLIHPDLHNGYLTILVCYGLIGFTIFFIFSFLVALNICKHIFLRVNQGYFSVLIKLFSALVAYCGYCLFEKAILFDMTFMVGFFWLILGYTFSYVNNLK